MTKGQIIGGNFGNLVARQKSGAHFEIGELLIAEQQESKSLLQVTDVSFGSQISSINLELISGMELEDEGSFSFMDPKLRLYTLATLKSVLRIDGGKGRASKVLPGFFSHVREVTEDDLKFLTEPKNPLFIGNLRSGSRLLDVPLFLNGKEVLSHHVLIPATTGKGKSNLTSVMLWDLTSKDFAGVLVLDPHDEYYDKLSSHPARDKVVYYSPTQGVVGGRSLKIHLSLLRPEHFNGVVQWSSAQYECLMLAYKKWGTSWIEKTIRAAADELRGVAEATLLVVKRRFGALLGIRLVNNELHCSGLFDAQSGQTTIKDILHELEQAKTVIVNTSSCSGKIEILVGSLIAHEVFSHYKSCKVNGSLRDKPVISIILEEAPRVLGKEVLEKGSNIFSTIAREGRKFQVGLVAITQLPSLIPRQVLANMNTKIILGIEMAPERQAIIESAAQDLSEDGRNIAALDKGEAIITSNFSAFAVPVKIPLFDEFRKIEEKEKEHVSFSGISIS